MIYGAGSAINFVSPFKINKNIIYLIINITK